MTSRPIAIPFALVLWAAACTTGRELATSEAAPPDVAPSGPAEPAVPRVDAYAGVIAPILAERCSACHGEAKAKGKLRLQTRDDILAGGVDGPVLVPGDPQASEMLRRLRLALADDDHMPPAGKPQPEAGEIAAIERWIAAGAPFEGPVEGLVARAAPVPARTIAAAPRAAIEELQRELVHVQPIAQGSNGLWIDFAAVARRSDDAFVARLLEPLLGQVVDLSLARCAIGDATPALCARMPNLRRLDLRGTAVGDSGVAALAHHAVLDELVLARTHVGGASVANLLAMPALRRVFVWGTALDAGDLERLRARDGLAVDAGDRPDAVADEVEPPLKLTSDAPLPGAPAPGDPSAPVNAICPVTGNPVNPKYTLTYQGRVIGFCCPNCPGEFEKDPAKYAVKLP